MDLAVPLDDFANRATDLKMFRYAEQLRAATLSVSNNIAEGSGCLSDKEFVRFLGYSRRSVFEIVNTLHTFERNNIITTKERLAQYPALLKLSKQIHGMIKKLRA